MSFKSDMDKAYQKKVVQNQERVVRATSLLIFTDLTLQTPVRTGRARANWLTSLFKPRTETVDASAGIATFDISGYKLGVSIFIANNLPYIRRLNAGWSKQAPSMFVDAIVQTANVKASKVIAGIR